MPLRTELQKALVTELNLEDVDWEELGADAPLFGEGLGLDSLDAVELVVLVQKHFGVEIRNMEEGRAAFMSLNALVAFIEERRGAGAS